ncbi:MAG: threonylcarbamoyl-AMP synthase [Deltaproteobacteria bacterium]|nr:threonylcarbamoyl-AMP synthase [Deltaproteobacteria bacterium]
MLHLHAKDIDRAVAALQRGELVAIPTETVYGLAGDATRDDSVARIFACKGRPNFNPLIAHVPDLAAAERLVEFDPVSRRLAERFWPGPLTLVLPRRGDCPVSWLATAGLDTLAIRVPDHPITLELLRRVGRPLAAPSANPSGRLSPTTAEHVLAGLGDALAAVLDGGPCRVGLESTVVQVLDGQAWLLRPGGLPRQALEAVAGPLAQAEAAEQPRSPGQLASHYAPHCPVRLEASQVAADEALLAFGPLPLPGARAVLNLSPSGDTTEAAAHLFAYLRDLDALAPAAIAVMPIPREGLGEAIADRLQRAAQPREAT